MKTNVYYLRKLSTLLLLSILLFTSPGCEKGDDDEGGGGLELKGLGAIAPSAELDPYVFTDLTEGSMIGLYQNQETGQIKSGIFQKGSDVVLVRYNTSGLPIGAYADNKYHVFTNYQGNSVTVTTYNDQQQKVGEKTHTGTAVGEITTKASDSSLKADTKAPSASDELLKLTSLGIAMSREALGKSAMNLPNLINTEFRSLDKSTLLNNISKFAEKNGYEEAIVNVRAIQSKVDQLLSDCGEYEQGLLSIMRLFNFGNNLNTDVSDNIRLSTRVVVSHIDNTVTIEGAIIAPSGTIPGGTTVKAGVSIGQSPAAMTMQTSAEKNHTVTSTSTIFSFRYKSSAFTTGKTYFAQTYMYINGKLVKATNIKDFKVGETSGGQLWRGTHKITMSGTMTTTIPGMNPITVNSPATTTQETIEFEVVDGKISVPGGEDIITVKYDGNDVIFEYKMDRTVEGIRNVGNFKMTGKMNSQKTKITGTSAFTMKQSGSTAGGTISGNFSGTGTWDATPQ